MNDLEHLRTHLSKLPSQLNWEGLRSRLVNVIADSQFNNTLSSQLQQAQSSLSREIRSALDTLGKQVRPEPSSHRPGLRASGLSRRTRSE